MDSPSSISKHFISVVIQEYTLMEETSFPFKKYCQFSIDMKSNKRSWKIFKRYKNFDDLQNMLIKKKLTNLPKLPPKRIFLSEADLKERISKLQKYLSTLISRPDVYKHEEILNFICIEKEDFLMLKENIEELNTSDESPKSLRKFRSFNMNLKKSKSSDVLINDNFYFGNEEEDEKEIQSDTKIFIGTFLKLLNSNILEKCKTIKDFEDSFRLKGTNKIIQREEVYRLLFGEKVDGVSLQGIVYHSGNIKDNQIGAESCLLFLSKLISSTYNTECELFKSILKLARLPSIQELNLESHLKSNRKQVVLASLNIVKTLVNEEKGLFLNKLLSESLIEVYRNFLV
jgi:hypothetical protein